MTFNITKQQVLDRLTFDPAVHKYVLDGMQIPSVTQVIDPFLPYANLPKDVRETALLRGTRVHELTHVYDTVDTAVAIHVAKDLRVNAYLLAWRKFLRDVRPIFTNAEMRLYHTLYRYAGTLDRVAFIDGRLCIIEIKTGGVIDEYAMQTAAYQYAYNEKQLGNAAEARYVVQLKATGAYSLIEHKDKDDFQAFTAALTLGNWRMKHGK